MMRGCIALLLVAGSPLRAQVTPRSDLHGNPLPRDAVSRIGSWIPQDQHPISALAFSPDGKLLASAGRDSAVRVWEFQGLRPRHRFPLEGAVSVALAPEGKLLAALTDKGSLATWDLTTGALRFRLQEGRPQRALAISPDGTLIATGGEDRTVRLWSSEDGRLVRSLWDFTGEVGGLAFSPDGRCLVSAARAITLWDVTSGKRLRSTGRDCPADILAVAPDGKMIAAGRLGGEIILLDAETLAERERFEGRREPVHLAFGPDGRTVVVAAADRSFCVFRAGKKEPVIVVESPQGAGTAMALSPDGKVIAHAGRANLIDLFDAGTGRRLPPPAGAEAGPGLRERQGSVTAVAAARGRVITASEDGVILISEAATGKTLFRVSRDAPSSTRLALSPDAALLAWTEADRIHVWDALRGKELHVLKGVERFREMRFSPDGRALALALAPRTGKGEVRVHESATGRRLQSFRTEVPVESLAFSPDGKTLSVLTDDSALGLWSLVDGKQISVLPQYELYHAALLSPNGSFLVVKRGPDIELRDVRDKERRLVKFDGGELRAVAFSPDERLLLSLDSAGVVRLHEVRTGAEVMRLEGGHAGEVRSVAFLSGTTAVTGGADSTALVRDLTDRFWWRWKGAKNKELNKEKMPRLWSALASEDGQQAMEAVWRLASAENIGSLLREALRPLVEVNPAEVRQLIADLDNRRFAVREQAKAQLAQLGRAAGPALNRALEDGPSLEMRRRIEGLLEQLPPLRSERLRDDRVVQTLEYAGSSEAKELLEALQTKAWSAEVRAAARLALQRMKQGN